MKTEDFLSFNFGFLSGFSRKHFFFSKCDLLNLGCGLAVNQQSQQRIKRNKMPNKIIAQDISLPCSANNLTKLRALNFFLEF